LVDAAVEAGADAVGFVVADSPRRVDWAFIAGSVRSLPPLITPVVVTRRGLPAELRAAAEATGFSTDRIVLQIDAEALDESWLGERTRWRLLPVVRLSDARSDSDEYAALPNDPLILVEGPASGVGQRTDWHRAFSLAQRRSFLLAGGLTPENVGEAIRTVRPWGVDVSSGVESAPGVKDPVRIGDFVQAVREADATLSEVTAPMQQLTDNTDTP
jgi:phosphoribosylanthranilate isomerase